MKSIWSLGLFLSFFTGTVFAQNATVKGVVVSAANQVPVVGATIALRAADSLSKKELPTVVSNPKGAFALTGLSAGNYRLELSAIGFQPLTKTVRIQSASVDLGSLSMSAKSTDLSDVTIIATTPPVAQKDDTTQYSAKEYKVNIDATTEDLIKKMPGITVARDGTVTAQGEQVKKVTIDGKDFFGEDASIALKNLPAEIVDKIQVFDKLSDQAQLTGVDDGNSVKAINVVTKSGLKNGQFGRAYVGYGTDERYMAGGNMSFFKGNRRISVVGNFNNINQQNFGSQDLLGLTSSGSRAGRGTGNTDNFIVGTAAGINKTNAFGINYGNQWGKKITLTGSYFFNNSNNATASVVNTETFSSRKNLFSTQQKQAVADNNNHRINMRLEYKLDSANSISIIPNISFQHNISNTLSATKNFYSATDSLNRSQSNKDADKWGYNIRNSILFRHNFRKRGRSFSAAFNTTFTQNDGNNSTDAQYRFFNGNIFTDSTQLQYYDNPSNGHTIGGSLSYTEPLSAKAQLQLEYNPTVQFNKADQQAFRFDAQKNSLFDSTLSNKFDNTITTNNAGLTIRQNKNRDNGWSVGVNLQQSTLESQRLYPKAGSVNQDFTNVLPSASWRQKIATYGNLRIFYRASTNFPSVNQLQDVVNLSNPLRVSSGNPSLLQSYTHVLMGRYSYANTKTSHSFFINVFLQTASDFITNGIFIAQKDSVIQQGILLKKGSQLTKPINLNGYKNLRSNFTYSLPIKFIKSSFSFNGGFSFTELPGVVNNLSSTTKNITYNSGINLASNISEYVDYNINYSANFNRSTSAASPSKNSNYVNQSVGINVNLLNKKGWFFQNDLSGIAYSGLSSGFNQSFWLWNASVGKKFFRRRTGELKLSVFDLLKENQSISRSITGSYIEDAQNQVLQQYFMLTFTYSLRNFGKPARNGDGGGGERMNRGREGGRPTF